MVERSEERGTSVGYWVIRRFLLRPGFASLGWEGRKREFVGED
jgi:hypothetical protein